MLDYPEFENITTDYSEQRLTGSSTVMSADGTPWVVRTYPQTQRRVIITHWNMTREQQTLLDEFYEGANADWVRFFNPRDGKWWRVLMEDAPQPAGMPTPFTVNVQMTMVGRPV